MLLFVLFRVVICLIAGELLGDDIQLVYGHVTIIFVVSVCLFVQSFSQLSSVA